MSSCNNNSEKSSTTKINKNIASGYSLFRNSSFNTTKNNFNYYRGKGCMERFCKDLKRARNKNN